MLLKFKHFASLVAVAILYLIPLTNATTLKADGDENFSDEAMNLVMRKIGHDILLSVGDSASRVLPIQRLSENEFQIRFESRFTFVPDTLINIVERLIIAHYLSRDYIVNVYDCSTNEVIFGYAMLESRQNNIVACTGRTQPVRCYYINIHFAKEVVASSQTPYIFAGFGLLAIGFFFVGAKLWKRNRQHVQHHSRGNTSPDTFTVQRPFLTLGKALFYYENQYLVIDGETIELTAKESKLLHIFAENPNQIIERNRLQKEVWEDEGVIVGRSLDMFISKLRKKLSSDSSLKLSNIHGKGYKLETMLQEELH
jgi:hypothetical protein